MLSTGYSLIDHPAYLVAMETLEPLCSIWMLLTASGRIDQHLVKISRKRIADSNFRANTWALIVICHYSFGTSILATALFDYLITELIIYLFHITRLIKNQH